MATKSPLQLVKDTFGTKEDLVKQLKDRLNRKPDETEKQFVKRLMRTSNKKLLHLFTITSTVYDKFGSKMDLVDAVLKLERPNSQKEDAPFKEALQKLSHARLLDRYNGLMKRNRKAAGN